MFTEVYLRLHILCILNLKSTDEDILSYILAGTLWNSVLCKLETIIKYSQECAKFCFTKLSH